MPKEIFQNRVSALPAFGIPNHIYYVPNGNSNDLDEYIADNNGIFRKIRNIPSILVSAGTTSSNLSTIIFSNSPTVTFGLNGNVITASAIGGGGGGAVTDYISIAQSSLFQLTSDNSLSLGTAYTTHTHSQYVNTSQSSIFLTSQTVQPVAASGSNGSFLFSTVSFGNSNGLSHYITNGSIVGSYTVPSDYISSNQSSLFQLTVSMSDYLNTNYTTHTHGDYILTNQSSVFQLTADNSLSLGTGYTTHTHSQYLNTSQSSLFEQSSHTTVFLTNQSNQAYSAGNGSNTFQTLSFADSNGVSFSTGTQGVYATVKTDYQSSGAYLTTAMASNRGSDFVQANAAFAGTNASGTIASNGISVSVAPQVVQTGISSIVLSNTTYTSGQISFRDGNGIFFASTTGQGISITHELQHTSNTSAITSNAFNTSGSSNFVLTANSSLLQHTSATSAITSAAVHTSSPRIQGIIGSNTTYTSGSISLRDLNGISWQSTTGQAYQITHALQFTSNTSAITSNAFNTSGSSNFVLTANSSLLQHTSATSAITSNALHTSAPRIQGIIGSNTTYTSGSVGLRDINGITWQSTTGQSFQITHDLQYTSNTSAITSNALNTSQSSLFRHTSENSQLQFTSAMSDYLGVAQSSKYIQNWKITGNTAGTSSSAQGTDLWLAGGNGVTISGSSNTLSFSVATNYQSQGAYLTTAAQSDHSHGNPTLALTNLSGTTASASNGFTISLSASPPGGGAQTGISSIAFSNTTYTSGQLSFRDGNGISWASTTGQAISITHDLQYTSATSAITSNAFNTSGSSNFVLTANSSLLQHTSATSNITSNALNTSASRVINLIAATNNTGGGTASLSSNVSFSAANGITFYTSAGSAIVASYNSTQFQSTGNYITTARASTDAIGLNTAQSNVTWTANSAGISLDARGYAGTGTTFNGANISGSITQNSNGLQLSLSAGAGGGVTPVASASNGSFSFTTLAFSNANNVTFGTSAGSIITASVAAPGAAAENNYIELLGANTAGNTTASGSTIGWSGQGVTLSGTNASQVVISAPATSSLLGTGQVSISVNGSTISIGVPNLNTYRNWEVIPAGNNSTFSSMGQNSLYLQKLHPEVNYSFNNIELRASGSFVSSTNSQVVAYTVDYGLYSLNASTYSSIATSRMAISASFNSSSAYGITVSQGAGSYTITSNNTVLASFITGQKHIYLPFTSTLTAGGDYAFGIRISSATTVGTSPFRLALLNQTIINNLTIGKIHASTILASNSTFVGDFAMGVGNATTSAMPTSIGITALTNQISQARLCMQFD